MLDMKPLIFILFSLLFTTMAPAQETEEEAINGHELKAACQTDSQGMATCHTFIVTLVQTVTMIQAMGGEGGDLFCISPEAVSIDKVRLSILDWFDANKTRLEEEAYILASQALHEAYPCRTGV